ncbi:hypothetical protein [Embleya sp. AB8]|uniref:hypothetical protein n=1 Tax=Embleya sp. AB8 TaxID=3156304 RepID=UPI003C71F0B8
MCTDADLFGDEEFERYERAFPGALHALGDTFPGPSPDLVARGIARGLQRRRARRLRRAALAAVLVTASIASWVLVGDAFDRSATKPADRTDGLWMSSAPRDLMPYLARAVPAGGALTGAVTHFYAADSPRVLRSAASVSATYTDSTGSSLIMVSISHPAPGGPETEADCTGTRELIECTRLPVLDGGSLTVRKTAKGDGSDLQELRALYIRPDSALVDVRVNNAYTVPGVSVLTAAPGVSVLTIDQITAVARSAVWEPVVAAVPTVAQRVAGLVPTLLPSGARVASTEGNPEQGEFIVETGRNSQRLNVSVQSAPADEQPVCPAGPGDGTCEIVRLSDGTLARIDHDRTVDQRVVPWALTAFRPHGLRVRFEVGVPPLKSVGDKRELSPPAATVTQNQVKAIAASPRWDIP